MPRCSAGSDRRGPPQQAGHVGEAMLRLPAEDREILFHANYLGWSVDRIACHFALPADVVKLRLHDALRLLAAAVGQL